MYTKEQKLKIFNTLSPDLKELLTSTETGDKIMSISKNHSLMMDQVGELSEEFSLLVLGLTKSKDFIDNISKRLEIPRDKAVEIADEINKEIIYPIRVSLQMMQDKGEGADQNIERPVVKPVLKVEPKIEIKEKVSPSETVVINNEEEIREIEKFGDLKIEKQENIEDNNSDNKDEIIKEAEYATEHMLEDWEGKDKIVIKSYKNPDNDPYREPLI